MLLYLRYPSWPSSSNLLLTLQDPVQIPPVPAAPLRAVWSSNMLTAVTSCTVPLPRQQVIPSGQGHVQFSISKLFTEERIWTDTQHITALCLAWKRRHSSSPGAGSLRNSGVGYWESLNASLALAICLVIRRYPLGPLFSYCSDQSWLVWASEEDLGDGKTDTSHPLFDSRC